jgi:uncharacterized membrane protein
MSPPPALGSAGGDVPLGEPPTYDHKWHTTDKGVDVELGAVELLVVGFPENRFSGKIAPALADLVDRGLIRVIDLVFVSKETDGSIVTVELSTVDDETRAAFEPLLGSPVELLHDGDIEDVGEALVPGSSAAIILFEHSWATEFRTALVDAGGELIDSLRIPPELVEAAQAAAAEEAG